MFLWLFGAAPTAAAEAPAATPAAGGSLFLFMIIPLALMWFMASRSQKKQQEAHRRMIESLKKGDKVVTAGGIIGEITGIDEDEFRLRVADKVEARFVKSAITRVLKS